MAIIVNKYSDPVLYEVLHSRGLINEAGAIPATLDADDRERAALVACAYNWLKGTPAEWLRGQLEQRAGTPTGDAVQAWLQEAR